ncbi:MAG: type I methionyl aminopeptidase [Bacteroidetes bacterium]|nr:type I methionyl aminopeptidase [Bacteroidota bacterium]
MGIPIKSPEQIELCRLSSLLVEKTLAAVATFLKPGITGLEVDSLVDGFIRDHGAVPSFKNYNGFPYSICFSVNEQVVHGFPSRSAIRDGDIVSVDVGVYQNGFHGDFAYTFAVGEIPAELKQLLKVTKRAAYLGVEKAIQGNRVGAISQTVQQYTESFGFGVVRELVGHGVGENLHESPEVPNYGKKFSGPVLRKGMVLAIEPMINLGKKEVNQLDDGWTIVTRDRKPSAHFEHNVAVGVNQFDLLSSYAEIETNICKNSNLTFVD